MESAIRRWGGWGMTFHHPLETRLLPPTLFKPSWATNHGTQFQTGEAHSRPKPFKTKNGTEKGILQKNKKHIIKFPHALTLVVDRYIAKDDISADIFLHFSVWLTSVWRPYWKNGYENDMKDLTRISSLCFLMQVCNRSCQARVWDGVRHWHLWATPTKVRRRKFGATHCTSQMLLLLLLLLSLLLKNSHDSGKLEKKNTDSTTAAILRQLILFICPQLWRVKPQSSFHFHITNGWQQTASCYLFCCAVWLLTTASPCVTNPHKYWVYMEAKGYLPVCFF